MTELEYVARRRATYASSSCASRRMRRPRTLPSPSRRRRSSRIRLPSHVAFVLVNVAFVSFRTKCLHRVEAGISFGGVTSTDACYDALQNAEMSDGTERVDRDGYVEFVNELSDNAFESFRYDDVTQSWGMYPVISFEGLPLSIKGVFYDVACGGEFVVCDEAYLITTGTRDDTNPQDVLYLFGLCKGVQDAIDAELDIMTSTNTMEPTTSPIVDGDAYSDAPTYAPTTSDGFAPTSTVPTTGPTSSTTTTTTTTIDAETFPLTYRAVVSDVVTSDGLDDPNDVYRSHLLGAMTTWTMKTAWTYNNAGGVVEGRDAGGGSTMRRSLRRRDDVVDRELVSVYPMPSVESDGISLMDVIDIDCTDEIKVGLQQDTDHCIEVTTNVTLEFEDEPPDNNRTIAIVYFLTQFEIDVENGNFHDMIVPPSTKSEFRMIYSSIAPIADNATMTNESAFDVDKFIEENEASEGGGGKGGPNAAGIAAGVCIGIVVFGVVGFLIYRRRSGHSWGWFEDKSHDGEAGKSKDGRESYATPDFDVVDGDMKADGRRADDRDDDGSSDDSSSRDRISSGRSDSDSASMASFSSSDSDSDSSSSTSTDSSLDRGSKSTYQSSTSGGGPASAYSLTPTDIDDDDGRLAPGGPRDTPASPRDDGRVSKRNVARAAAALKKESGSSHGGSISSAKDASMGSRTPTDDDSSAGSSGWDSSDDDSTEYSGSVESYKGDLDSSKSGGKGSASTSTDSSTALYSYSDQGPSSDLPATNYLNQRGVTMIPIVEEAHRSSTSSSSTQPYAATPDSSDIEDAIEMGDWTSVGATAAILASSKTRAGARVEEDDDSSNSSAQSDADDDNDSSGSDSSGRVPYGVRMSTESIDTDAKVANYGSSGSVTVDSDIERAAEIDRLVESGNWDGVVAVAARYVEEADEADEQLRRPLRNHSREGSPSNRSAESDVESVSIETADESSAYTESSRESTYATGEVITAGSRSVTSSSSNHTRSRSTTSSSCSNVGIATIPGSATSGSSTTSSSGIQTISTYSSSSHHRRQKNAYRAEVEALVRRVVPDELSNVDDILIQFSGREQELIDTLRAMQEKSIAQRARAAVQRSAKREAGKSGRDPTDDESSEGISASERSVATLDPSERSSNHSPRDRRDSESITSQFAETETEDYSVSESSEGATTTSYSTGTSDSRSGTTGSEHRGRRNFAIGKVNNDTTRASAGLSDAIDASDWRAVGANARELQGDRGDSVSQESSVTAGMSDMVEEGNWSGIIERVSNMTRNGEIEDID